MTVDRIPADLPSRVADRARRHAQRMSSSAVILVTEDRIVDHEDAIGGAATVLAIRWPDRPVCERDLIALRRAARPGAELVMLARQEHARRVRRERPPVRLVEAVRAAGWTIASIARFTTAGEVWIDLTAIDLEHETSHGVDEESGARDDRRRPASE